MTAGTRGRKRAEGAGQVATPGTAGFQAAERNGLEVGEL